MQAIGCISKSQRVVARVLRNPLPVLFNSSQLKDSAVQNAPEPSCDTIARGSRFHSAASSAGISRIPYILQVRLFSSEDSVIENDSKDAETAKGVYDKMLSCVAERRTAPPNALLWSLLAKCSTNEDIKLLFDILQKLRIFRLSNLRIPEDFNSALCREVTKACVHVGAIDLAKKALWKNNLFGLTPDIGSANQLLLHAKQHGDEKLMVDVMKLVKKNDLPLQPGTADIVFSICSSANRWGLISKYGKRFVKSGVRLRQTSFDLWMEFAARKGDVESLWKIEKWRSEAMKQHSLSTGFSCAKAFLLDHKPESAAAIIHELNQPLSDARRPSVVVQLQKLASEWALEVIKHKKDNREAFAAALQNDISTLVNTLLSLGVEANVTVADLTSKEWVSSNN